MKVLVVDDEALIRRSLSRVLRSRGHEAFEAVDGLEGRARWQEHDPDLVFLDVLMPGMTGPELLEEIGAGRRAKVILMSAFSDLEDPGRGADLFVAKPFEDLFAIVAQAEELCRGGARS